MLRLTHIFIYPIKGCSGIALDQAELLGRGIKYDRRWMLVDESGNFISQRGFPELAMIDVSIDGGFLQVAYKDLKHQIPLQGTISDESVTVKVWDDYVSGFSTAEADHQWFSQILNKKVRLVAMLDQSKRPVDPRYAVDKTEEVSFADGYPFLVIGENALHTLNNKMAEESLKMDRFRPNLVFSGGEPHEEDLWQEFKVGDCHFYGVKPCARCQVTTIDQQTGAIGKEPLKTLSTYRKKGNKILFGQNCLLKSGRVIRIDDEITVLKRGISPIE